jgi:hypothetical protein
MTLLPLVGFDPMRNVPSRLTLGLLICGRETPNCSQMAFDLEKELKDLKRRVDFAEMRLSQLERPFNIISGQLRHVQIHMHARFDDLDRMSEMLASLTRFRLTEYA